MVDGGRRIRPHGNKPSRQILFTCRILPGGYGRVTDQSGGGEKCLHFGGLHTVPPDLDLEIAPPQVQETAIGQQSAQIAGAEQAPVAALRIRHKDRLCQLGMAPIASGEIAAPHYDFADSAPGYRLPLGIPQQQLDIFRGVSRWHGASLNPCVAANQKLADGTELRPAEVHDHPAIPGKVALVEIDITGIDRFAAQLHQTHQGEPVLRGEQAAEVAEHGGHREEYRDLLLPQPVGQAGEAFALHVEENDCRTIEQGAIDVPYRTGEARGVKQRQTICGRYPPAVGVNHRQMQHIAMVLHHSLGFSGGARGVEHIRQAVGGECQTWIFFGKAWLQVVHV